MADRALRHLHARRRRRELAAILLLAAACGPSSENGDRAASGWQGTTVQEGSTPDPELFPTQRALVGLPKRGLASASQQEVGVRCLVQRSGHSVRCVKEEPQSRAAVRSGETHNYCPWCQSR